MTISIDLETYSDVNIKTSGVYRYVESADFEILLFGYSVDGGEVRVLDLKCGDEIPEDILHAIVSDDVIKWAFNASFERLCLSMYLRRNYPVIYGTLSEPYLSPESWRCSMVWAAYMGLPLSLDSVGKVLNLSEQKLDEGKALIRYFSVPCAPTKANGLRTRNLPEHAPEKWERFKAYNKRDVETEMAVQARLRKFPVPDHVWDEYHLDQEINDRGILLDMDVVENAICIDEQSRKELMQRMKDITGLENPNSVLQMRAWLAENGVETDSLDSGHLSLTGQSRSEGSLMKYEAHDYQTYAAEYIVSHPIAAILLSMGLGKTSITLTAIADLLFDLFIIRRVLIIAPLRVAKMTWSDEIGKWDHLSHLRYSIAVGSAAERIKALHAKADIYIINRENVPWLIDNFAFDFDMIVVDELSSFKNHQSKRFKALMKVRPYVKRIVGLTGTPSANGLMDLFAEFKLLDMGERLGRFIGQYRTMYFKPDRMNGPIVYSYRLLPGAEEGAVRISVTCEPGNGRGVKRTKTGNQTGN